MQRNNLRENVFRLRTPIVVAAVMLVGVAGLTLQPTLVGGSRLLAQAPSGPDTTTSTTENSTGKVTAVSADTISVTSKSGPVTYELGPDLHVIGSDNSLLTINDVHKGQSVTVYYYLRDGKPTVTRIVLLHDDGQR